MIALQTTMAIDRTVFEIIRDGLSEELESYTQATLGMVSIEFGRPSACDIAFANRELYQYSGVDNEACLRSSERLLLIQLLAMKHRVVMTGFVGQFF